MKALHAWPVALSAAAVMLTPVAGAQTPQPVRPGQGGPQVQPPRPGTGGPQIQPPRPGRPEIQPPRPGRPEIQPPRPQPPQPPRPPRPPIVVNPGPSVAVLYSARNYRGNYVTVRRSIADLRVLGFNDRVVSLRSGGRWLLCSDAWYRGRCVTVRGSEASLGRISGTVSSIKYLGR